MYIDLLVMAVSTLPERALLLQLMYECGEQAEVMAEGPVEAAAEHLFKLLILL
jgi:hypothetical protein